MSSFSVLMTLSDLAMALRSLSDAQKRVLQGTKAQRQGWKDGSHVPGLGLSIYSPRPFWAIQSTRALLSPEDGTLSELGWMAILERWW